jgi:hypothetical protein
MSCEMVSGKPMCLRTSKSPSATAKDGASASGRASGLTKVGGSVSGASKASGIVDKGKKAASDWAAKQAEGLGLSKKTIGDTKQNFDSLKFKDKETRQKCLAQCQKECHGPTQEVFANCLVCTTECKRNIAREGFIKGVRDDPERRKKSEEWSKSLPPCPVDVQVPLMKACNCPPGTKRDRPGKGLFGNGSVVCSSGKPVSPPPLSACPTGKRISPLTTCACPAGTKRVELDPEAKTWFHAFRCD